MVDLKSGGEVEVEVGWMLRFHRKLQNFKPILTVEVRRVLERGVVPVKVAHPAVKVGVVVTDWCELATLDPHSLMPQLHLKWT